jgi:putative peptidoglycan binding protein
LRFGIAAILLPVLVVLAAGILYGGKALRTSPSPYSPASRDWAADGRSGVGEADAGASLRPSFAAGDGERHADLSASEIRAPLVRDMVDARPKNGPGPRYDDLPPFNREALRVLPSAGGASPEESPPESSSSETPDVPSPAARPARGGSAERPDAGGKERSTILASPATRPDVGEPARRSEPATARQIADAQSKLAALGYDPGPADGRLGSRTEAAIRKFRKAARLPIDGLVDDRLLARLDAEAHTRAPSRRRELAAISPGAAAPKAETPRERSILGSVLGGFQRLLGRDFDSVHRPAELAAYCRGNSDTWVYDFGREAFVYCGNVAAGAR